MTNKLRVKFCWQCGKKLHGNHYEIIVVDGYEKICHKICAKNLKDGTETCITSGEVGEPIDDGWGRGLND